MNNKINIIKNAYILFGVNIMILILMFFLRTFYIKIGYNVMLVNVMFLVNILFLMVGIIYNVLFLKQDKKYDNNKFTKLIIIIFLAFILINTVFISLVNKPLNKGYKRISEKLASYCNNYGCDGYETINSGQNKEFIIKKMYFDYDNVGNELKIITTYNNSEILSVEAEVYSRNEMYSETLIKDVIKDYFYNFNYEVDEEMIKQAFDERFNDALKKDNATYKVTEIYNDDELSKIKTNIVLDLKQE